MSVCEVNPADPAVREAILSLQRIAFGSFSDALFDHILLNPPRGSVVFAVYDGADIVAVNCFIAHSVHRHGETGIAYQSCMSATRKDQKGKGHFSNIIDFAKNDLRLKGGKFIFGYPNGNSGPIFTSRLGFTLSNNLSSFYLRMPLLNPSRFDSEKLSARLAKTDLVTFDYHETAQWKRKSVDRRFFEYEELTNYLFGTLTTRKFGGLAMPLLVVGGIEINKPHQINRFLSKALKLSGTRLLRIISNVEGPISAAAGIRRTGRTEPLIAFPLMWDVDAVSIEALSGLKDVH